MNFVSNKIFSNKNSAVILPIFLHLLIVLPLAYFLNIWVDEASTLYTTQHGFFHAWQNALADEKQAPLYFWFLSFWRMFNDSVFFARLFSIICSSLAIKFFSDLARKVFNKKAVILATFFFAFHPYLIWASLEIRVYSAVILLSVLLLKVFYNGYFEIESKFSKETQIFYIFLAVISLYTNYYLGFLLVGNFFALLALQKWREAKNYFLQMILAGIIFLPLIWAIKSQFSANASAFQEEKSFIEGIRILWNVFLTFALPTEIFTSENLSNISFFRLWFMRLATLASIVLLFKDRGKIENQLIAFATICVVIALFLIIAYFLLGTVYVAIRHMAILFAPLVILIWLILENILLSPLNDSESRSLDSKKQSFSIYFLIILIGLFFSYSIFALYPNLAKRGDWKRVGEFIEKNERADQPIVVFATFDALALPYHYKGINRIFPDEKFFDWWLQDEAGSENGRKNEINFIISEIPQNAQEIWLLTNAGCKIGQTCQPLENFVQANYTVIEEKDFYEEKVRLLRKKGND